MSDKKLDMGQRHIIKLIARDRNSDGWAKVSEQLYKALSDSLQGELVEFERQEIGGRARLTEKGESVSVFLAMDYFNPPIDTK